MLRSPDTSGPGGGGRYLVVVNSGFGVQLRADANEGQQLLQVVDLAATPVPAVVQDVYFPSPQSASVGAVFGRKPNRSGAWPLVRVGRVRKPHLASDLHTGRTPPDHARPWPRRRTV